MLSLVLALCIVLSFAVCVLKTVENGITNGTSANTFRPNGPCARGQVVTFLCRHRRETEHTKIHREFFPVDFLCRLSDSAEPQQAEDLLGGVGHVVIRRVGVHRLVERGYRPQDRKKRVDPVVVADPCVGRDAPGKGDDGFFELLCDLRDAARRLSHHGLRIEAALAGVLSPILNKFSLGRKLLRKIDLEK